MSQPAFTAGTKNSSLNATIRKEAMQPWALSYSPHGFTNSKTEFGIFTNDFIFIVLMLTKTYHSINKEARPVLNSDWMKIREILEIGIREIMW